jgi:glycosyltransferase involved in cell wall biosynthesis
VRLSIVLPAYNEEDRLNQSLPRLVAAASSIREAEIVLVDDGSSDATAEVALMHLRGLPHATVYRLPWNLGKGAALRLGVSVAKGDAIVFMDADLAGDVGDLPKLVGGLEGADIVVGSRLLPDSEVSGKSLLRRALSRAFITQARAVTGLGVRDPQCGFKAYRAEVAKLLFGLSKLDGFAFDVEILVLARRLGYRVVEVPIAWQAVAGGRVRLLRDSQRMFIDVLKTGARHLGRQSTTALHPQVPAASNGGGAEPDWVRLARIADRLR